MLPVHSQGRAGHRRSYSQTTGAFSSLGALPRRRSSSKPTFHLDDDEDSSSPHDDLHDDELRYLPPLRLKLNSNPVPFPRSSPLHSPTVARTSSSPTVPLRKPLKSSLKSSTSSPNIPFPSQSLVPSIMFPDLHPKQPHQRASSAPCTPLFVSSSGSTSPSSSPQSHSPTSSFHHVSKNVHFPSQEEGGLATVRVFNRSARPASLSRLGEETETETEGEGSSTTALYGSGGWAGWSGKYVGGSTFPFPRVSSNETDSKSPLNPSKQKSIHYQIDWSHSSPIPRKNADQGIENVFFESLQFVEGVDNETVLQGTLLVRNITYQKTVMVRYTLDDWETVNDVAGWYHTTDPQRNGWDRFKFSISLCASQQGLEERVMWLVGKYAGASHGEAVEWWDNNEGKNYRVGFKKQVGEQVYKRGVAVSAPTTPTSTFTRLSAPQMSFSMSEEQQERERAQHQAAVTESTLARLKKLNLKNYAAPRRYASPTSGSPVAPNLSVNTTLEVSSPTLSATSLASTDSTPLQTPTLDDEEEGWKINHEEQEEGVTWSLHTESDHFSTTPPTPTLCSTPISTSPPPLKQKPTPPKLNLATSVFNPPVAVSSPSSVQSPSYPRRQHRHYQPMSSASPHPSPPPLGGDSAASDAIYQALVREWCFAQAPSSSSSSGSGERTPVVAKSPGSPSPLGLGLVCALGDE